MPGRRIDAWMLLGLLGGCDPAKERELAAVRAELAATLALVKEQGQRIESLTSELAKARADRAACEIDRSPPHGAGDAPPAPATDATLAGAATPTLTPTCADGTCVVKRSELEAFMAAPEAMARLARVLPAMEDGKAVGFKLFAIRSESPLALLGFKMGTWCAPWPGKRWGTWRRCCARTRSCARSTAGRSRAPARAGRSR
ncbi:hypothetical protein [Nannocystis pusilla]|uniref:hypothetical protein n=1 Tax=Nannocystis pusilla TaxID=889268 RepID=UPI003DA2533B